jgi:hypothetical protein
MDDPKYTTLIVWVSIDRPLSSGDGSLDSIGGWDSISDGE